MKNPIILFTVIVLLAGAAIGAYVLMQSPSFNRVDERAAESMQPEDGEHPGATEESQPAHEPESVIGTSVQGRDITAYHYGNGDKELLFVGGIHGGYEWNTVLLAYELMDYLEENPNAIPGNVQVTVIPALNPDGLQKVAGTAGRFTKANVPSSLQATMAGRFNANSVDLNRNFDCDWQPTAVWQDRQVNAGNKAFSEPESQALKEYAETRNPNAVVFWYSAADGVFASSCGGGILPETRAIMNAYAAASGYPAYDNFDFYEITGDAANWLAKSAIPAFSVLLSTHEDIEWEKNRAGIEALLGHYAE